MQDDGTPVTVLFYTSATKHYLPFLPLYVYFAALNNPTAVFEFIVDDADEVEVEYEKPLSYLRGTLGIQIVLRDSADFGKSVHLQNTLRFVMEPKTKADFVYIGDIDIMIVQDVMKIHGPVFDAGLPYSNVVRKNTKRLTGLHFTRYEEYYPLPEIDDIIQETENDEEVLYKIVERSGALKLQYQIDAVGVGRPTHGIHMSLNRIPISHSAVKLGWGFNWIIIELTYAVLKDPNFDVFLDHLPMESRGFLANVYFIVMGAIHSGKASFTRFTKKDDANSKPKDIFTQIYETNAWRGTESVSGPSSNLERTKNLRSALPKLVEKYGITSIVDVPCGDFFWMKEVVPNLGISYIGGDIVADLVDENNKKYSAKNIEFRNVNLLQEPVPTGDLIFCRDLLFHLSYADIATALTNFVESDCRYIMTTSHINRSNFENTDITTGGWRWMDLFAAPFFLPHTHVEAVEDGGGDRFMYVWEKEALASAVKLLKKQFP
ncbi:MAG: class I SAM-dependent methyltransferase [Sulfitobacter sp.]